MLGRPTKAELQAAIHQLEHLGDYQTYFSANTTLSSAVPHYQEYNYLHNLVMSSQTLVDHYDDADWLDAHQVANATFRDALTELNHAYRGCSLILELNRTANTSDAKTEPTPTTSDTPTSTSSNSSKTNTAQAHHQTTSTKTTVKAETFATPTTTANTSSSTTPTVASETPTTNTQNHTNDATAEIAVPTTGNVETTRQISGTAVFAVVLTGAIVASLLITVILRREPRHTNHMRRHR